MNALTPESEQREMARLVVQGTGLLEGMKEIS